MKREVRYLVHGAIIAAMYAALCHLQNGLLPNSASWPIQFRAAETLCVLALFTPAAISGLTIGCLVFNITYPGAMPLDIVMGTAASLLAAQTMWLLRKHPWVSFAMPALWNAVLVGWELSIYFSGGFWMNALYVAIGEAAVLYTLGALLYTAMKKRELGRRIFGEWTH